MVDKYSGYRLGLVVRLGQVIKHFPFPAGKGLFLMYHLFLSPNLVKLKAINLKAGTGAELPGQTHGNLTI